MVDTYTKWMLTIIATTLVVLAANNVLHTAVAAQNFARVQICDQQNCMHLYPIPTNVQGRTVTVWGLPVVRSN
jgi:hypothetical protein